MSQREVAQKVGHLDFKWGKRKGFGVRNKDVQFYESFMYDGVDYSLYDCVYVHNNQETEPYIGKIFKIWEKPNKSKYVKVHWFFRPCEISHFIKEEEVLQNEIFLASGKGLGVDNVIMLETIGGKCDVLCISKDKRNPQPTAEELEFADHVFGRTFDVANYRISNDMGDKVSGLEVKFVFNRNNHERDSVENINLKVEDAIAGISGSETKMNSQSKKDHSETGIIITDSKTMSKSPTSRQNVDSNGKLATAIPVVDKKVILDRSIGAMDVRPSKKARVEVSEKKSDLKELQFTSKPDDDERSKWFRPVPWLEKMKEAHEQGTLVILFNLDPGFTSKEVEDIIWHAFKEKCSANMIQRTTISNPYSGQAFIILRSRETTKKVVKQLNDGCLMLSNGRVLVGSILPSLTLPGKQSTFVGHISLEKVKFTKKGAKEAVSTSHCSQPNTIEFDMALEWRLLQARSDHSWKLLYKQQEGEVKKVKAGQTL